MAHAPRPAAFGLAAACTFLVGCTVLSGVDDTTKDYGKADAAGAGRAGDGGTGGAGAGLFGGEGGASAGAGGAAGAAGNSGAGAGSAGTAGNGGAGQGGVAGQAGKAGSAGQAGEAGQGGTAGKVGAAGQGGTAGQASCAVPGDCPSPPSCRRAICVDKICQLEPVLAGTACTDDGNVCNGAEKCDAAGTCTSVEPVVVTDNDACTVDACDPASGGVSHKPIDANDDDVCTIDSCSPSTGVAHVPVPPTTTCELAPSSCASGFHRESLVPCSAGDDNCTCATTTAFRQTCAADCGGVRTFCTPAAAPACPAGFHREVPRTCCGGDCAAYTTSVCTRDDPSKGFPTCEPACPTNYHPTEMAVGASSQCTSTMPADEGRRLRCEANTDNFIQCGTTCPPGYQAKNSSTSSECGAGSPNRIRCQK